MVGTMEIFWDVMENIYGEECYIGENPCTGETVVRFFGENVQKVFTNYEKAANYAEKLGYRF